MRWSYGVTTVPSRRESLLPKTLASLKAAGFDSPRLFVDGCSNADAEEWYWKAFNVQCTCRYPPIYPHGGSVGNWCLSLGELYIREPNAERYAIFQDDFVTYKNLKAYLERTTTEDKAYWNCYTFPSNQSLAKGRQGWYESNQFGRGAVALIFSNEGVRTLLTAKHLVNKPRDAARGHKSIDGAIIESFRQAGWKEYVHNPSLTQHMGDYSSMRNKRHQKAASFKGEDFDALCLLET